MDKKENARASFKRILKFANHFKIIIFTDPKNSINNLYISIWRITNNIDANRDIFVNGDQISIDATTKFAWEGYEREWPDETLCDRKIVENLVKRQIVENDPNLFLKFDIF